MTVAETNTNEIFYVVVERNALLRGAIAVRANNAQEAERLVLEGNGIDVGYMGHVYMDDDMTVLYSENEAPFGITPVEERFVP